jgi:hypothetical protein
MHRFSCLIGIAAVIAAPAWTQDDRTSGQSGKAPDVPIAPSRIEAINPSPTMPVFIENQGQFDPRVKFQVKFGGQTAWLTAEGIVFDVTRKAAAGATKDKISGGPTSGAAAQTLSTRPPFPGDRHEPASQPFDRLVFAEDLVEAKCCSKVEGRALQPGINNYFLGADASKWRTNVRAFSEVVYHDAWPNIDIRVYGNGSDLEQELFVQPGGDLRTVQVAYRGIEKLSVSEDGSLEVATAFGTLRETKPKIFQTVAGMRKSIEGRFKLTSQTSYTFDVPLSDPLNTLVIDPTLLFSTYIGGSNPGSGANGVAVDAAGNAYITGTTLTGTYPTTVGAFQSSCPSSNCTNNYTPFVSMFDPVGRLQYSTFLGSTSGGDTASAIAVSSAGNAYITGNAQLGFPTTPNAYHTSCPGVFMAELNSTGTALVYSTCLPATQATGASGIALGNNGKVYLTGYTSDKNFPITSSALQQTLNASTQAYVSVIDPSLTGPQSLVYSTYLGGVSVYVGGDGGFGNWGYAITADAFGNAYVTGGTFARDFPVTAYAFQKTNPEGLCFNGLQNPIPCETAFVSKINPTVSGPAGLIYSTYLGGTNDSRDAEYGQAIAVDGSGNAYVSGITFATDFPVTAGAFWTAGGTGTQQGFLTKLSASGGSLIFSTYLGNVSVSGIALDASLNSYVTGTTRGGLPTTPDAFQPTFHGGGGNGGADAFLTEVNSSGSNLVYSSYLGGSGSDGANGVAVDAVGDVFVAGSTQSSDFPTTQGAYQSNILTGVTCSSAYCPSAFLTKFPLGAASGLTMTGILPNSGGNSGTVTPEIIGSGFHAGATVTLNCGGQRTVAATAIAGTGGRILNAGFDLTALDPGTCDVVVTNPDGMSVTKSEAFTIQQGGAPNIQISLSGVVARALVGDSSATNNAAFFLTATNTGAIDAPNSLIMSSLGQQFSLTAVQPSALADVATIAAGGAASWIVPNLATKQTSFFTYFGTFDPALPPFFPVTGGPVFGIPVGAPLPIPNPIIPPPEGEAPSNVAEFLACVAKASTEISPEAGHDCIEAVAKCKEGVDACTEPSFENINTCFGAAAACVSAVVECSPLKHCLPKSFPPPGVQYFPNWLVFSDPNALTGPSGVGGQRWTSGSQSLTYETSFGNETTATAPVQRVVITQPLGANVNLSTLSLPAIIVPNGSSNVQVPIPLGSFNPAVGLNEFATNIDLRPTQSLLVSVDAKLNPAIQTITWTFTSIDPATGLPPLNPLVGFLPPGAGASVSFSVAPQEALATGSQVNEQATVIFGANAPMSTPTWTNTIDNSPPTSQVAALPPSQSCPNFKLSWSGTDVGSGLGGFTVYTSDNSGPFAPWLTNTTATSGTFTGMLGHTYSFYSIAQDLVGNVEAGHSSVNTTTQVTSTASCTPPSLSAQVLSTTQTGTSVTVNLQLTNTGLMAAQSVNISQIAARTLSGSGTVTLNSPSIPAPEGSLAVGASTTVSLAFTVPSTVTRFSLTENGNIVDANGKSYNYSLGQVVVP